MSDSGYSDTQRAALGAVLDTVVPPSGDGRLPGAGELGLAAVLEAEVPELRGLVAQALAELDERARGRGARDFAALTPEARSDVLTEHAGADPGFLPGLTFQIYLRYYHQPRVVEALGLEPRPPHPLGYALEQADLDSLLAGVRAGPRRYREV